MPEALNVYRKQLIGFYDPEGVARMLAHYFYKRKIPTGFHIKLDTN